MATEEKLLTTLKDLVRPEYTALVIIDMQNDFCHKDGFFGKIISSGGERPQKHEELSLIEEMIPNLVHLIEVTRSVGTKIYSVRSFHDDHYLPPMYRLRRLRIGRSDVLCPEGEWGSEQFEGFEPKPGDTVITKHVASTFIGTDFKETLEKDKIRSLIITGVNTHVCCESTIRDGNMLGFYIIVPRDCVAARIKEAHEHSLAEIDWMWGIVTTSQEIIETWKK